MDSPAIPAVSVIMNCRNAAKFLAEAIDSVLHQTFCDYEVIIWDNQSTDGSADIAARYTGDRRVRYFRGDAFLALGAARNAAIDRARGRYLAFLDCDDIWLPEMLGRQVALLDSSSRCGFVYADAYRISEDGIIVGRFSDDIEFLRGDRFSELLGESFVSAFSSVVIRRDAVESAGGFRPQYNICEEYDLFLRIADRYSIDYSPEPLVKFRWHGANTSRDQGERAREALAILDEWTARRSDLCHEPLIEQRRFLLQAMLAVDYAGKGRILQGLRHGALALRSASSRPGPVLRGFCQNLYKRRLRRSWAGRFLGNGRWRLKTDAKRPAES